MGSLLAPKISYKILHYHLGTEDAEINSEDLEETLEQVLACRSHPAHRRVTDNSLRLSLRSLAPLPGGFRRLPSPALTSLQGSLVPAPNACWPPLPGCPRGQDAPGVPWHPQTCCSLHIFHSASNLVPLTSQAGAQGGRRGVRTGSGHLRLLSGLHPALL